MCLLEAGEGELFTCIAYVCRTCQNASRLPTLWISPSHRKGIPIISVWLCSSETNPPHGGGCSNKGAPAKYFKVAIHTLFSESRARIGGDSQAQQCRCRPLCPPPASSLPAGVRGVACASPSLCCVLAPPAVLTAVMPVSDYRGRSETVRTWETPMRGLFPLPLPSPIPYSPSRVDAALRSHLCGAWGVFVFVARAAAEKDLK